MRMSLALAAALVGGAAQAADIVYDGGGLDTGAHIVFEGGGEVMMVPTGRLSDVAQTRREDGLQQVAFRLSEIDAARFAEMTARLEGRTLRISLCGTVLAEPTVMAPILSGDILIIGGTDAAAAVLLETLVTRAPCL